MKKRRPNPRLVKTHRPHSIQEIAETCGVTERTVGRWLQAGLNAVDECRPTLVTGRCLRNFLTERLLQKKRTCSPAELYCMRCRAPRVPLNRVVEYLRRNDKCGHLRGTCRQCGAVMHRASSDVRLKEIRLHLTVFQQGEKAHSREGGIPRE